MSRIEKHRNPLLALVDALLTLIDLLCRGVAWFAMTLLRGCFRLLGLAAKGLFRLTRMLLRAALWPIGWLWRQATGRNNHARRCLRLTGEEFEAYAAKVLEDNGFRRVRLTPMGGDQGVDILAERNGLTYAVQCKNYAGAAGNFAVQEAYAGKEYYGCDRAAVLCPGGYTRAAQELAEATGVALWGERELTRMMRKSGRRPHHRVA